MSPPAFCSASMSERALRTRSHAATSLKSAVASCPQGNCAVVGVSRVVLRHGGTTHHKFYNVDQLDAEHLWSDGVNRSEEGAHVTVCSVRGLNAVVVRKRGCSGKRSAHEGQGVTRRGASFEFKRRVWPPFYTVAGPRRASASSPYSASPCRMVAPSIVPVKFFCTVEIFPLRVLRAPYARSTADSLEFVWGSGVPSICGYLLHTKGL